MTKFKTLLANFRSGEISPKFFARKTLQEYGEGAELLENFIPMREGGFRLRPGTEFIADVSGLATGGNRGPGILPFITSKNEAYVVVIQPEGNLAGVKPYIRIFKNDGVESTVSPFLDVEAPPADLDPKGFAFAQIGDVMFLTHTSGRFRPLVISKRSVSADDFAVVDHTLDTLVEDQNLTQVNTALKQPYRDANISPITLTPSVTTGSGTLTASQSFFNVGMVNCLFKITHGAVTGIARVTGFNSDTSVNITVLINFGSATASDNWEESSWSIYRGYPRTVAVFEQRLVWGGNKAEPDTLWFSRLANVFVLMQRRLLQDFAGESSGINYFIPAGIPSEQQLFNGVGVQILEDDAFSFSLGSKEVNPISWMSSGRRLLVGTLGAEYIIGSENQGISILTVVSRQQTNFGGSPKKTIRIGNEVLYYTRDGRKLRTFKFNEENGSYISADVSILGEHLRRIGESIFSEFPNTLEYLDTVHQPTKDIVWSINSTNTLVGMVYSKENGNISWFRTKFPNANMAPAGGSVNIWGITSIPNEDGGNDDLWMVVERSTGSGTKWLLERMGADFEGATLAETLGVDENIPLFVDSALVIDNTAGATIPSIGGLGHLEGLEVRLMYRGVNQGTYTVAGGQINLPGDVTDFMETPGFGMVGIPYVGDFISLDPEAGRNFETSEGDIQRIDRVHVRFYNTRQAKVGSRTRLQAVNFKHANQQSLGSGLKRVEIPNSPDLEQAFRITTEDSNPCTVLGAVARGVTYD